MFVQDDFIVFNFIISMQPDPNVKIAVLKAVDQMDDGTEIKVAISINKEDGSTSVDFTGTGKQVLHLQLIVTLSQ